MAEREVAPTTRSSLNVFELFSDFMMRPKIYDSSVSFKDWLPQTKIYIEKLKPTDDAERVIHLKSLLDNHTQNIANKIRDKESMDFNHFCEALQKRISPSISAEEWSYKLAERRQKPLETNCVYADAIFDLCCKAYDGSAKKVIEKMAISKFCQTVRLPDCLERYKLFKKKFVTLDSAIEYIDEYESASKLASLSLNQEELSESTRQPKHNSFNQKYSFRPQYEHKQESTSRPEHNANQQFRPRYEQKSTVTCFKCGNEGHVSPQCKLNSNFNEVECYYCHGFGHFAKQCPKKNVTGLPKQAGGVNPRG